MTYGAIINPMPSADADGRDVWNVVLHSQYIKDLSFESPAAPVSVSTDDLRSDVSVHLDSRRQGDLHESELTITVTARADQAEVVFIVELSYAGLFELSGVGEEARSRFIFCEAPRILFPWVCRIIADVTRDGGLPQLNLSPPDFAALYEAKRSGRQDVERNHVSTE